jgi:hypothetical protein
VRHGRSHRDDDLSHHARFGRELHAVDRAQRPSASTIAPRGRAQPSPRLHTLLPPCLMSRASSPTGKANRPT